MAKVLSFQALQVAAAAGRAGGKSSVQDGQAKSSFQLQVRVFDLPVAVAPVGGGTAVGAAVEAARSD